MVLNELEQILAQLYGTSAKARNVVDRAGIPAFYVDMDGAMRDVWHSIVAEAINRRQLLDLIRIALEDYPQRTELKRIYDALAWAGSMVESKGPVMGDRWNNFSDVARLGERVTVLETRLPLIEAEINRRLTLLSEGQNSNRAYSEKEFSELRTLLKAGPGKPQNDRLLLSVLVVGALVTAVLLLVIIYGFWFYNVTLDGLA